MFFILAHNTLGGVSTNADKVRHRPIGWVFLAGMRITSWVLPWFGRGELGCLGSEIQELQQLGIGGTSVESWLAFCHSNMVSGSSFISMREVVKEGDGSFPIARSARKCC